MNRPTRVSPRPRERAARASRDRPGPTVERVRQLQQPRRIASCDQPGPSCHNAGHVPRYRNTVTAVTLSRIRNARGTSGAPLVPVEESEGASERLCITTQLPLQDLKSQPVLIFRVRVIVVFTLEGNARAPNWTTADVSRCVGFALRVVNSPTSPKLPPKPTGLAAFHQQEVDGTAALIRVIGGLHRLTPELRE